MEIGQPAPPRVRSIVLGLALTVLLLCAFVRLPSIVKAIGALAMFLPDKIGLVDFPYGRDIIGVDFSGSPSAVVFPKPGAYLLYTDNYDLLVINDGVIESSAPPWITASSETGQAVPVELVRRGLIMFDTPFAAGRPALRLLVQEAGTVTIVHPRRATEVHFVPDYITGNTEFLTLLTVIQIAGFGYPAFRLAVRKVGARRGKLRAYQAQNRARIRAVKNEQRGVRPPSDRDESPEFWRPKR